MGGKFKSTEIFGGKFKTLVVEVENGWGENKCALVSGCFTAKLDLWPQILVGLCIKLTFLSARASIGGGDGGWGRLEKTKFTLLLNSVTRLGV